jgi:hypothetical protein
VLVASGFLFLSSGGVKAQDIDLDEIAGLPPDRLFTVEPEGARLFPKGLLLNPGLRIAPGLDIPPMEVYASAKVATETTDNAYLRNKELEPERIKSNMSTVVSGHVRLETPMPASYESDVGYYQISYTPSIRAYATEVGTGDLDNRGYIKLGYRFSKLNLMSTHRLAVGQENDFERGGLTTRIFYNAALDAEYWMGPKTSVLLSQTLGSRSYAEGYDAVDYGVRGSVNYQLTPEFRLGVGPGVSFMFTDNGAGQTVPYLYFGGGYRLTEKIMADASVTTEWHSSDAEVQRFLLGYSGGLTYSIDPLSAVRLSLYRRELSSNTLNDQSFVATGIYGGVGRSLFGFLHLDLGGGFENNTYVSNRMGLEATREDNAWYVQPTVTFNLRDWWNISLSYRHRSNASNVELATYESNDVNISSSMRF